jgi:hypothetical protein
MALLGADKRTGQSPLPTAAGNGDGSGSPIEKVGCAIDRHAVNSTGAGVAIGGNMFIPAARIFEKKPGFVSLISHRAGSKTPRSDFWEIKRISNGFCCAVKV